ncbi:linker for activation of T-cells family member 2 isoform X2 [Monodon monoceros]|uniref:linker for activation of T-cells family member 2 isoform X2 n=1 Tax=Monodon monoceros TaxID=40151 RepID=UPI0010F60DBD|nr:linker for activation of T-cells family member 2 isoform X2 [Monodon monoceros]
MSADTELLWPGAALLLLLLGAAAGLCVRCSPRAGAKRSEKIYEQRSLQENQQNFAVARTYTLVREAWPGPLVDTASNAASARKDKLLQFSPSLEDSSSSRYQNFSKGRWASWRRGPQWGIQPALRPDSRLLLQEVDADQMHPTYTPSSRTISIVGSSRSPRKMKMTPIPMRTCSSVSQRKPNQGTRSLRVIRTQHPSGSGRSPGESWVCGQSPSASKWSPSAGSEGPGLGQTVEGRGREGSLGDLAWEDKAGWAPLWPVQLIPQRSFWHISGCRGSNCARTPRQQHHGFLRLGPPGRLPIQLHARHRTRPAPGRTHLWQIPERTGQTHHPVEPFLRAVWWREQGWACACELSDHLPAGRRAGPEGSTSLPGRKPRRGRRGARLREWGRGSHQSLEKPWRKEPGNHILPPQGPFSRAAQLLDPLRLLLGGAPMHPEDQPAGHGVPSPGKDSYARSRPLTGSHGQGRSLGPRAAPAVVRCPGLRAVASP